MDIHKEWFTLKEAAEIIRPEVDGQPFPIEEAVKEVLEKIFENELTPSCFIEKPVLCGLYTEILTPETKKNNEWPKTFRLLPSRYIKSIRIISSKAYFSQKPSIYAKLITTATPLRRGPDISSSELRIRNPFNVRFTGLIDICMDMSLRNIGSCSGMIELHPNRSRIQGQRNHISLISYSQAGQLLRLDLIEPYEIAESAMLLRRNNLLAFISNNSEAMKRFEQLSKTGNVNETLKTEITELFTNDEKTIFLVPSIQPTTPNSIFKTYTFKQVASFLKTHVEDVFDTVNGYVLDTNTGEKHILINPCTGKTTLLYPSIDIDKSDPVLVQSLKMFGKRNSGFPASVLQDVLQHPLNIRRANEEQHKKAKVYRHAPTKNFVTVHEKLSGVCLIGNRLEWSKNGWARVTSLSPQVQAGTGGAVVGPYSVHKDNLVISSVALDHYREETGIRVKFPHDEPKQAKSEQPNSNKSGAPTGPLSEAVKYVYLKFREEGNTEILRKGKIKEFLERLKELADEKGNKNYLQYVADRIEKVKMSPSGNTVTTKEQITKTGNIHENKRKSRTYTSNEVTKQLTFLRKQHPLPT